MNYSTHNFSQAEIKDLRMGKVIIGSSQLPDAVYGQTTGQRNKRLSLAWICLVLESMDFEIQWSSFRRKMNVTEQKEASNK